jgi:hypothetical protein
LTRPGELRRTFPARSTLRGPAFRGNRSRERHVPCCQPPFVIAFALSHVGIALPAQDGFAFTATDPHFELLDGSSFRRLEQLEATAQSMARAVAGRIAAR